MAKKPRKKTSKAVPPHVTDEFVVVNVSPEEVDYTCGHRFARSFAHNLYGQVYDIDDKLLASRRHCGACLLEMTRAKVIRCALCGRVILPGDGVAVYDDDPGFNRAWVTSLSGATTPTVIGCIRMDCCPSGGFYAGNWSGEQVITPNFQVVGSVVVVSST